MSFVNALLLLPRKSHLVPSEKTPSHRQRMPHLPAGDLAFPGVLWLRQKPPEPRSGWPGLRRREDTAGRGRDTALPLILHGRGERPGDGADGHCRVSQNWLPPASQERHPRRGRSRGAIGEEGVGALQSPLPATPCAGPWLSRQGAEPGAESEGS